MIRYGIVALLLAPIIFTPVSASPPQYGIALSKGCTIMLKNDLPTTCPTYEQVLALFPDTTDQSKSGEFQNIDGIWQRGKPSMINSQRLYDFDTERVLWVDPPSNVRDRIIMITIDKSLPPYKTGEESITMDDYNISFQKDRYVDKKCKDAIITAENWIFLTGDTLNYMRHECDKAYTSFDGTVTFEFEKTYQDLSTSAKYKLDQFIKESLEKYKVSFIGSNESVNNRAVTTNQDE